MVLAENLKSKNKFVWGKYKKVALYGAIFLAVVLLIFGIISLSRIFYAGNKEDLHYETGDQPLPQKIKLWVKADGGLYLREKPETGSSILKLIPNKTELAAEEVQGDWYRVVYMEKTGWVNKEFVTTVAPSVSPTKDWEKYSNKTYGYSLIYPVGWVARDYGGDTGAGVLSDVGFGPQLSETPNPNLLPPVALYVSSKTLAQVTEIYTKKMESSSAAIKVAGLPAKKYIFVSASGVQMTAIFFEKDSKVYIIEESGGYATELSQMSASIKF